MKFILLFLVAILFLNGCTSINTENLGEPTTETTTHKSYDYRWVDNDDVLNLIDISLETDKVNYKDVINKLGEPVFSEKLFLENNNGEKINSLLFWYKYKSKIYPVAKQETTITKSPYKDAMGYNMIKIETDVNEFEQIKPVKKHKKSLGYNKWEPGDKWLVVIMFDNTFELVITNELDANYAINRIK